MLPNVLRKQNNSEFVQSQGKLELVLNGVELDLGTNLNGKQGFGEWRIPIFYLR
jgi:hypothetical protein